MRAASHERRDTVRTNVWDVQRVSREGAAAWPTVAIAQDVLASRLGDRLEGDVRGADLYLAVALELGDRAALQVFESSLVPALRAALGRACKSAAVIDEVVQRVRVRVLVGSDDAPAKITSYTGRGSLGAWLRVTAMRAALKLLRKDTRETPADDAILEARAEVDDPELAYMKAAYRASFRAAFQEALESLHPKERTLLKQQIVDGLGIDELGALYQVHRATAARWVASAREKLLGRTRRTFMLRARITSDECESIMRLVKSQLDVSLHRRLTTE